MLVFALLFPFSLAIAVTVFVHVTNNIFKLGLMSKQADWRVLARLSLPVPITALAERSRITPFDKIPLLASCILGGLMLEIAMVKAVIGFLIVAFAFFELPPRFQALSFPPRWLPLGGALSGFLSGQSAKQAALR